MWGRDRYSLRLLTYFGASNFSLSFAYATLHVIRKSVYCCFLCRSDGMGSL
jgi:hypothetical protein